MDDIDNIIWAVAGLVFLVGCGVLIRKGLIQKLSFKAGPVEARVDMSALHSDIREMKEAVAIITTEVKNGKKRTLVERVDNIEANQLETHALLKWQNATLMKIADHVGFTATDAPTSPEHVGEQQGVHQ